MAINKWFGPGKGDRPQDLSIDDLIALGRYEEAEQALRSRLRSSPRDLHSRLRLAEVLKSQRRGSDAVDEYLLVAQAYARDGFYDKALALLAKVSKLAPGDDKIALKIEGLRRAKNLEQRRDLVIDSLLERRGTGLESRTGTLAFELQRLWTQLAASPLLERLSDEQLRNLFGAFRIERVERGQELARKGETKEVIYLLGEGEIEVRVRPRSRGTETVLRAFSPGDLVGDRALLEHRPWPARYVASQDCTVLLLDREGLEKALTGEGDPRGLLDALREQRHDHQILDSLEEMATMSATKEAE